ncbi:hypothetical protein ABT061_45475 [Streptosporangium sp. NPDC002544]|uniref:hypothetical protein n=1 Tax=Streptosporangium sp. NPDC002544 TaxID=3154538 RepID=UPI003323FBF1
MGVAEGRADAQVFREPVGDADARAAFVADLRRAAARAVRPWPRTCFWPEAPLKIGAPGAK